MKSLFISMCVLFFTSTAAKDQRLWMTVDDNTKEIDVFDEDPVDTAEKNDEGTNDYGKGYTCKFITGDGEGDDENWVGYITHAACFEHCTKVMNKGGDVNGITVYASGEPGCWCEQKMTHIDTGDSSYKTCYLKPIPQKHFDCHYEIGDGEGGSEYWIGYFNQHDCAQHCIERRNSGVDTRVNGATVYSSKKKGCYCEYGMSSIDHGDTSYKSCFLRPRNY